MAGPFDFTGQNIENTYQRVLQTDGTSIYDGTGSLFTSFSGSHTGSFTGSFTGSLLGTASNALTASYINPLNQNVTITGSLIVSGTYGGINTNTNKPNLFDINGIVRVDWSTGVLNNTAGDTTVDWEGMILNNPANADSIDWGNRWLYNSDGVTTLDWGNGALIDSANITSIDWESRRMIDAAGFRSADFNTRYLIYPDSTTPAINYGTQGQIAMTGSVSVTGSLDVSGSITQNGIDLNSLMIAYAIALG